MSETTMPYNPIEFYGPESQEQMQQQEPTQQMTPQYQDYTPPRVLPSLYNIYVDDSPPPPSVWVSHSPSPREVMPQQNITDSSASSSEVWKMPSYDSNASGYNPNTPPTPPNNANSTILEVAPPVPQEENASLNSSTENGEEQNKPIEQSSSGGNNSSEIKKIII
jgi:hypothetical protein